MQKRDISVNQLQISGVILPTLNNGSDITIDLKKINLTN